MRWLGDLVQKLATIVVIVSGGILAVNVLLEPALETSIKVALLSGLALLAAAIFGPGRAANISAEAAREVAEINAQSARAIEQIKAQGQLDLEREKDHREWRRQIAEPVLQDLLERSRMWTRIR